jgi:hypothetical protein
MVRDLLKPNGKFVALWWTFERREGAGPPFPCSRHEIFQTFSRFFNFDIAHVPKDSVAERKNAELFTLMSLKQSHIAQAPERGLPAK